MTDTELAVREEAAIESFDYGGLYDYVEDNYQAGFSPWKIKLVQRASDENGEELNGVTVSPGKFIVGPMDGTGQDVVVDSVRVLLLDYFNGRIANEKDAEGNPTDGNNSPRICGSYDGIHPFFPKEIRDEFEDEADIHTVVRDWRQPELGDITITPQTLCSECPMAASNILDEDGNWLVPPCQPYPRVLLYDFDREMALEWRISSYNVRKPIEGRKRVKKGERPIPGIRALCYPPRPGEPPAFLRVVNGVRSAYPVKITVDKVPTNNGPVYIPVLSYDEAPLEPGAARKFQDIVELYKNQKQAYLEYVMNASDVAEQEADGDKPKADPDVKSVLGTGKGRKRRLGAEDDEL